MTAYGMYGSQVLQEVTGVEIDGTVYTVDQIKKAMTTKKPSCPVCGTSSRVAMNNCNRGDCTDGRNWE